MNKIDMALSAAERINLALVRDQSDKMLHHVETWAAINSGSRNLQGLADMARHLGQAFAPLGGHIETMAPSVVEDMGCDGVPVAVVHGDNIRISKRPHAPLRICLTGHYDTVFAADHAFQNVWREGDVLRGPGVADMKGGIAVMLAALTAFEASPFVHQLGWDVVLNADEEVGSLGSMDLLRDVASGVHAALTFEPALLPDGTLAGSRKGSGNFAVAFTGKAAHAGRNPQEGRNAMLAAADFALRLAAWPGARQGLSVNVARIEGGGPVNIVPDHAIVRFNIRSDSHEDVAWVNATLALLCAEIEKAHEVQSHSHGHFTRPPKPLDARQLPLFEMVRDCGQALGIDISWKASGGVCDGNNLAAFGLPVVDTMGVRGGGIHSDQEYLLIESLVERAELTTLLLMRLAQRGLPQ